MRKSRKPASRGSQCPNLISLVKDLSQKSGVDLELKPGGEKFAEPKIGPNLDIKIKALMTRGLRVAESVAYGIVNCSPGS